RRRHRRVSLRLPILRIRLSVGLPVWWRVHERVRLPALQLRRQRILLSGRRRLGLVTTPRRGGANPPRPWGCPPLASCVDAPLSIHPPLANGPLCGRPPRPPPSRAAGRG